jgi:hypothetical protein
MWWIVAVVVLVVLAATYVTWLASRVDRLHARAAAARAALDAHLVRRAAAALELADAVGSPPLSRAARAALAEDSADPAADDRPAVENDLTWALRDLPAATSGAAVAGWAGVVSASRRVALGRQVHDELVRDALAMRRRRLVRLLRLTRRHTAPRYFDVDDPMLPEPSRAATPG